MRNRIQKYSIVYMMQLRLLHMDLIPGDRVFVFGREVSEAEMVWMHGEDEERRCSEQDVMARFDYFCWFQSSYCYIGDFLAAHPSFNFITKFFKYSKHSLLPWWMWLRWVTGRFLKEGMDSSYENRMCSLLEMLYIYKILTSGGTKHSPLYCWSFQLKWDFGLYLIILDVML